MTETLPAKRTDLYRGQPLAVVVSSKKPPEATPVSEAEWQAMSENERRELLLWFAEEEQATTEGITVTFPRVKYPTSGTMYWQVPTAEGQLKPISEISMVVLAKAECRVFY